jgi:hypothetical protein
MTKDRARAYARVMKTLRDIGPATLQASEQSVTRHAADALLFCANIAHDRGAWAAYSAFGAQHERLVASGRWTPTRAEALADDVWACGPGLDVPLQRAA